MSSDLATFDPPFCPNPECRFHVDSRGWRWKRNGHYRRSAAPHRVQRYICRHCRRNFGSQTFRLTYWLKRPDLPRALVMRLVACSCYRQIAREIGVSPTTVLRQVERLGRHCLLFHDARRPRTIDEPLVIDGFETFEYSQYTPVHFHVAVGARSHFVYGFTDSELRRKGRMTRAQRNRRAQLEKRLGRPDPRSIEKEMRALLEIVVPEGATARIRSDEHPAYLRALRALEGRRLAHERTSSTEPRDARNPLFAANLLDLLLRHSSANHKRETIAFSKRRQSAAERLFIWVVWRNYLKSLSERARDATPAERLGVTNERLAVADVLEYRVFPTRSAIPDRWAAYYWRRIRTRAIPNGRAHRLRYAF